MLQLSPKLLIYFQFYVWLGWGTNVIVQVMCWAVGLGPGRAWAAIFYIRAKAIGQFALSYLAVADISSFLTNFLGKKAIFEVKDESRHPKSGPGWVGILKNDGPRTKFWVGPLCYEIPLIFIRGISQSWKTIMHLWKISNTALHK